MTLPLTERVVWLRKEVGSHDKLAAALGTSRQTIISWEKGRSEPKRLLQRLAKFSGCPPETWLRHEGAAVAHATIDRRLQALEEQVRDSGREMARAVRALTRAIERLERRLDDEAPQAMGAGR